MAHLDTLHERHPPVAVKYLSPHVPGPIIGADGFEDASAETIVAIGRRFASNPNLPYRLKHNLPLTPRARATFRGGTEKHYSDLRLAKPR